MRAGWFSTAQAVLAFSLVGLITASGSVVAADPSPFARLQQDGIRFGPISIQRDPIFDLSDPAENKWLYRSANRLHVTTLESVVRAQLLFAEGDLVTEQAIEETARVLRRNSYIYDVVIEPLEMADGRIAVRVTTRDNWTLFPQIDFSQQGGQTEFALGVREANLLGTGGEIGFRIEDDGDRRSSLLQYGNRNFRGSWWRFEIGYRDSDDGDAQRLRIIRPFYSLDSRWSAGLDTTALEQEEPLFSFGDEITEFRRDLLSANVWFGRSRGLQDGWTRRWQVGFAIDDNRFEPVIEPGQAIFSPVDRNLRYPYVRYEAIEDRFIAVTNLNRIAVTEDLFLGTRYSATFGWFGASTGADRDGALIDLDLFHRRGDPTRSVISWRARLNSRVESGRVRNGRLTLSADYVRRQSEYRQWAVIAETTQTEAADLDQLVTLGGLTGLRGFDRAYANGTRRAVVSLEQRIITNWYPWRLFRVGAAAFVDAGRIWGRDVLGRRNEDLLANVGVGLRLMSTRASSNRMLHIDLAYPVAADTGYEGGLQLSIQGKRGF
ncbi:MAG: hypothetical protein AAF290_07840 [Pseudomonadota bacterium]